MSLIGNIVNIQPFSVNDGDGIRTTIFLEGCPLKCRWCSNPDSWLDVDPKYKTSKKMTLDEVIRAVEKDLIFLLNSNGGVTFSGGEPTLQQNFLRDLVNHFYNNGIHIAIETCGYFNFETCKDIFEKIDHVFLDIKNMDSIKHKEYTGVENNLILENVKKLASLNKNIVIRIPIIPGFNDNFENIRNTAIFVKENILNPKIELLPYHKFGVDKYKKLGLEEYIYDFNIPSDEYMKELENIIKDYMVDVVRFK